MSTLSDARKRYFIIQLLLIMENNASELTTVGYDPVTKIAGLKLKSETAEADEVKQQETLVAAKDATKLAQDSLDEAYKEASATVELITGLLGKDHNLVKEIRKMRK